MSGTKGSSRLSDKATLTARLFALILKLPRTEQETLLSELEARYLKGRRKHVRKPFFVLVDYASQNGTYKNFTQNISVGGVFIETRMPFTVGEDVALTFPLSHSREHIRISGEIVRTDPEGVGVRFKLAHPRQETMIKSLLESI